MALRDRLGHGVEGHADPVALARCKRRGLVMAQAVGEVQQAVADAGGPTVGCDVGGPDGEHNNRLVDRDGKVLKVTVRDYGHWRPPRFDTDRNHGLLLIDSLMTRVEIDRAEAGTTIAMELDLDAAGDRAA